MKKQINYQPCEFCDSQLSVTSPPHETAYKKGEIHIKEHSVILLDMPSSELKHAADISGHYCNIDCLVAHLRKLREEDEDEETGQSFSG